MERTSSLVLDALEVAASADNSSRGDYFVDGIRFCGRCRSPKQLYCDFPDGSGGFNKRLVPVACKCAEDAYKQEQEQKLDRQFIGLIREKWARFPINEAFPGSFGEDDSPDSKCSGACRKYVEHWENMRKEGIGVLLYGGVGSGKSFLASCIANGVLQHRVPAIMTSFPRLLNVLQGAKDRQAILDYLQSFPLLCIDDLGAERDSSYASEQVYNVVDSRLRSGLPLVVTTNLTLEQLRSPQSLVNKRIFDRVLEACPITLLVNGSSRRAKKAAVRAKIARSVLGV